MDGVHSQYTLQGGRIDSGVQVVGNKPVAGLYVVQVSGWQSIQGENWD